MGLPSREALATKLQPATFYWVIPLCIGLILAFQSSFSLTADMGFYINRGLDIYLGKGYTHYSRSPGFPILIAAFLTVLGHSATSAIFVVQLFTALNVVLVYFLGDRLYGRQAGLVAAVVYGTSPVIYGISLRNLDVVIAFFMILSVLVTFLAFQKRTWRWFGLAGFVFGLSYLVKAPALMLYPLPLAVYWIERRQTGTSVPKSWLVSLFAIAGLTALPWAAYVVANTGDLLLVLGGTFNSLPELVGPGQSSGDGGGVTRLIWNALSSVSLLFVFIERYLGGLFPQWFLFLPAWGYAASRAAQPNDTKNTVAVTALILLSPLIIFETSRQWRISILLPVYMLTFTVLGGLLVAGCRVLERRYELLPQPDTEQAQTVLVVIIILMTITPQLFFAWGTTPHRGANRGIETIGDSAVAQGLSGGSFGTNISGGFYGHENAKGAAVWLANNSKGETPAMTFPDRAQSEIYFRSQGNFKVVSQPLVEGLHRTRTIRANRDTFDVNDTADDHLLYVSALWSGVTDSNRIRVITQENLLTHIRKSDVQYIVTLRESGVMQNYFDRHPQFSVVYQQDNVVIFSPESESLDVIEYKPRSTRFTTGFLSNLQSDHPADYKWYKETFLERSIGLNESQLRELESGNFGQYFVRVDERVT
jgi:hypothetical protein